MTFFRNVLGLVAISTALATAPAANANVIGVRAQALPLLVGYLDVSADVGLGSLVLSPRFINWDVSISELSWKFSGVGASLAYHFNGAFTSGLYIGAGAQKLKIEVSDSESSGSVETTGPFGRIGYEWNWSSFYLNLGGEFTSFSTAKVEIKDNTSGVVTEEKSFPSFGGGLDFGIGFSF